MSVWEYIKEFQGIIGVLAGLGLGQYIRNEGTVIFHPEIIKHEDITTGPEPHYEDELPESVSVVGYRLKGNILLENTSESMKSVRDLKLIFRTIRGEKKQVIQMESIKSGLAGTKIFEDVTHVNIPAKSLCSIRFQVSEAAHNIYYRKGDKVYLQYKITNKRFFSNKLIELQIE